MYGVLNLFCGMGGCALGFQRAGFDLVGAVDAWPLACEAFERLTGVRPTCADLSAMEPGALAAACTRRPDVVVMSPPCKGNSGCLPAAKSKTPKYRALNALAYRAVFLALSAWDTPPPLLLLENVPRITTRSAAWLEDAVKLLHAHGYAVHQGTHDCGELGGLAQRRRRYLLVARHMEQVPALLFEPPPQRVRGVGEVLWELPQPRPEGNEGGRLHRLPRMSALNWVRLALIPAGGDWRDLPAEVRLPAREARQNGGYGVNADSAPSHAVVANGRVVNTWVSVADPRLSCAPRKGVYGVQDGEASCGTVVGAARPDNGAWTVADPRIVRPRREGSLGVTGEGAPSAPVIAKGIAQNGPWQVADPRLGHKCRRGSMRVQGWAEPSHTVIGDARANKGANVADPRVPQIEGPLLDLDTTKPLHLVIEAADGTWHRPLTTLELAVLQGFPAQLADGSWLDLPGGSQARHRELIGNAIPPPTAEAIARSCATTLRAAAAGGFLLSCDPVWVSPEALEGAGGHA